MNKLYIAANLNSANSTLKFVSVLFALCTLSFIYQDARSQSFQSKGGPFLSQHFFSNENEAGSLDASPPVITYTSLANTCTGGNRTLTATITDADGVPTSGPGLPVLYWKVNSGTYNAATATWVSGNTYNFTFGGTAFAGSVVSYYIVAQDNFATPNVVAKPSAGAGGYSSNPPDAATPPTTPDFYLYQTTLTAGVHTVGATAEYLTITDAINAYNNSCLAGAVIFELQDASYGPSESFPILIYNPVGSAANSLTIKPKAGVNTTITGSSPDALFKFNGCDYVTIDGSNSGGSTRNLSMINSNTGTSSVVIWLASFNTTNGATNNTIKNCNISGQSGTTTFAGIAASSGVVVGNASEAANTNNTYQNNAINKSYHGIYLYGPATGETGNVISTNLIGSTLVANKIGYRGLYIANETGVTVNNNTVNGINSTVGISSEPDASGGIIVSGLISGGNIFANRINDIRNTNTLGSPVYGISLQTGSAASGLKVHNNFIYDIVGFGNSAGILNNGHGIALLSGGGYGIFYNSIHLVTNQSSAGITAALYIGSSSGASLDIRNNIFSNRQSSGTRYSLYCSLANNIFSSINYNDYYSSGFIGYLDVQCLNIGAWQAATAADGNSTSANPIFVSATAPIDLHLQLITPLNDQGTPIAGITADFDGTARSATIPDIGAHEVTPPPCGANAGGTVSSTISTICNTGSAILSSTGFSYGVGIAYQWESSTDNVTFANIPGETNPTSSNPPVISATTYYRLRVTCNAGSPGYSNTVTVTVNTPQILTSAPATRCGTGTLTLGATSTPGTVVNWFAAPTGGASLITGNSYTTPSLSSTTLYYAEATYTGSNGSCGPVSPTTQGGSIETQLTSWKVYFDVIQATTLVSVDVFPKAAGEGSTIQIYNSNDVLLVSIPYITTVSGGATAQTVPINYFLPADIDYYMYTDLGEYGLPPSGLSRNGSNAAYPYNSSDIRITGNSFLPTYYMCYYNWKFSNACTSVRTAVAATITSPPAVTANSSLPSICSGLSADLTATSSNALYTYSWMPGSLSGATVNVSPITSTTYTVTANDGTCVTSSTVSVSVTSAPAAVNIAPVSVTKCTDASTQLLTASGGALSDIVLAENFNGAGLPAGWQNLITGSALVQWTLRPNNYNYVNSNGGNIFRSNDNSQFYLANSDAGPTTASTTTLITPAFSLTGYTSASLSFWHHYTPFDGPVESINVERSANGSTGWVSLYTETHLTTGPIGTTTGFVNKVINLSAYAGQATNYIRFRYVSRDDFWWALDNVVITGSSGTSPITWSPTAGLFTDAAGTLAYTGTPATTVYANPAVTTTYTATASSVNGCTNVKTIDVTMRPLVSATISGSTTICPAGNATLSVALTGTGPWNLTYTDGVTPVPVTNIAASPYVINVSPAATTTYSITALSDVNCIATASNYSTTATVTISPTLVSTWIGLSPDWLDGNNWCGGVPTVAKDVVIPSGPVIFPVITTGTPAARDISIGTGASVTIDAGGTLSISGNVTNDGTIINNGTLVLNGNTAQSFPGGSTGSVAAMNIFEVNKPAGAATINNKFTISGLLKPVAGAIVLNDSITMRSDAAGTASIDKVGVTSSFSYGASGKFIIERYIPTGVSHGKSWQLLATPAFGQTVNQAWQEGASGVGSNPKPGYGTTMSSNLAAALALGFDFYTPAGGTTIKTYNDITNSYDGIANTTSVPIANPKGYMLFVRGDRSVTAYNQAANATIMRTTGKIYSPGADAPPSSTVTANKFQCVGNPYASAIDFTSLLSTSTGLNTVYYVWDPLMPSPNGYGAFQTISSSNGYVPVPGGTANYPGGMYTKIQSGQAFFVFSTPGGTVNFTENNKIAGNQQVFRPLTNRSREFLRLFLSGADQNMVDGNVVAYDPGFDDGYDLHDALKLLNFGENAGIWDNGKSLAIDARNTLKETDTIFYQFNNLRTQEYHLRFVPENMQSYGFTGILVDKFTGSQTPVSLADSSVISFTITSDPASKASDRFYLIFKQLRPVPVTITYVDALLQDKQVLVKWKVENELNIFEYEVEKSADGRQFVKLGTTPALGNGNSSNEYALTDEQPFTGYNYYRIKSIGNAGDFQYSRIVKVWIGPGKGSIVLYPNPVKDKTIGLMFNDQPKGIYAIRVLGNNGQLFFRKELNHPGGNNKYALLTSTLLAGGIYWIEINLPGGGKEMKKILVE